MEVLTDDAIFALAAFCSPRDLVNLALTCKRLGGRPGGVAKKKARKRRKSSSISSRKKSRAQRLEAERAKAERASAVEVEGRPWSLVEEAAKRIVDVAKDGDEEWGESFLSGQVASNEPWILVYRRLLKFRTSLVFSSFIGDTTRYVKGDLTAVQNQSRDFLKGDSLAFCNEVMKTGKHYVEFRVAKRESSKFLVLPMGLMRPIHQGARPMTKRKVKLSNEPFHPAWAIRYPVPTPWGYERYCSENAETPGFEGDQHCFFLPVTRQGNGNEWFFPVPAPPNLGDDHASFGALRGDEPFGSAFGFLLDLDEGTLTLYQDGRWKGVIKRGLGGHYRWAAFVSPERQFCYSVKVKRARVSIIPDARSSW